MIKFTHIDGLHIVVRYGKEFINEPVKYRGTVKLHGTNSSVTCTEDGLFAQSRNRRITVDDDNAGFAAFIAKEEVTEFIRDLEATFRKTHKMKDETPVTFYGEWIGPGIQNGVAVCKLPERQWVIFAAKVGSGDESYYVDIGKMDAFNQIIKGYEGQIYSIFQGPVYENEIDFKLSASMPQAVDHADRLTEAIEECCPWAKMFGIEGMGEGIVWVPVGKHWGNTDLFFKTKGEKHKNVNKAKRNKPIQDPEVIESIDKFVEYALTENRLNQGIEYVKEMGHAIDAKATGIFLKWVGQDVQRECRLELQDNDLKWKQVSKAINTKARDFYIQKTREVFKEGWTSEL